jgi:hypothetical protein
MKPPLKPGSKPTGKGAAGSRGGLGVAAPRGGLGVYYHSQGANALGRAELSAAGSDEVDEDYQRVSRSGLPGVYFLVWFHILVVS